MAVLADHEISRLVRSIKLIDPFDITRLQPASYDVVLSEGMKVQSKNTEGSQFIEFKDKVTVSHGDFIIASTEEVFNLPDNLAATLALKSTIGRMGMSHCLACWADPGFKGQMTLELYVVGHSKIELYAGMKIGQMVFQPVASINDSEMRSTSVDAPYHGRYQNQRGATLPREEKSDF